MPVTRRYPYTVNEGDKVTRQLFFNFVKDSGAIPDHLDMRNTRATDPDIVHSHSG